MFDYRRYSYIVVAALAGAAALAAAIYVNTVEMVLAFGGLVLLAIALWYLFHPRPATVKSMKRLRQALGSGRPVLVHFFSPFSLECILLRGRVSRMEKDFFRRIDVLRVDTTKADGQQFARELGAITATFILYDKQGREAGRTAWASGPWVYDRLNMS